MIEFFRNFFDAMVSLFDVFQIIINNSFEVLLNYYMDHPLIKIVLAFAPAILGVSYPLIIQTISRLDDQYSSSHIIEQFKKEPLHIWFRRLLILSVISTVLLFVLDLRVFIFSFTVLASLLIVFFNYVSLLLNYLSGEKLLEHIKERISIKVTKPTKAVDKINKYWESIFDLYVFSIKKDRRKLNDLVRSFIYEIFAFYQHKINKESTVSYPSPFHNGIYRGLSKHIENKSEIPLINIADIYFATDNRTKILDGEIYYSIWRVFLLFSRQIEERNDLEIYVKGYWSSANQNARYFFYPQPEWDENYEETPSSIEKRRIASTNYEQIIELHNFFGALLFYKKQYSLIRYVWFYSNSEPPQYNLLFNHPQQVIEAFINAFNSSYPGFTFKRYYSFDDMAFEELGRINKGVISVYLEYLTLLFLRLYFISDGEQLKSTTSIRLPKDQNKRQIWIRSLKNFSSRIKKVLRNRDLVSAFEFEMITPINCLRHQMIYPINYVEGLINTLVKQFDETLSTEKLDPEKIKSLHKNACSAVNTAIGDLSRISVKEINKEDRDKISDTMEYVRGTAQLIDREAFMSNQSISYMNYDAIFGPIILDNYYNHLFAKLSGLRRLRYKISHGKIFEAMKRLQINENHIIISFNLNFDYYKETLDIEIEEPPKESDADFIFNQCEIYNLKYRPQVFENIIFVLKKDDMPMIDNLSWNDLDPLKDSVSQYWKSFNEPIDKQLNVYAKFVELNQDDELKSLYIKRGRTEESLKDKIEITIDFLGVIWFKKDVKIVELSDSTPFQEGGIDELDQIKPFN